LYNEDEVLNHLVEFAGDGLACLSLDERLTIANMTTEWGALAGLFPTDETTITWLKQRLTFMQKRGPAGQPSDSDGQNGQHPRINAARIAELQSRLHDLQPDVGAAYSKVLQLDLDAVQPHVSGPDTVKKITPVSAIREQHIRIDKAYLLSCVNSRLPDIAEAAAIVRGRRVAAHVAFYLAAASSEVQAESETRGDWQSLLDAGAIPLPAGCGPCIGMGAGVLEDGEVGISATNRNFRGRMGSPGAKAYLASPAVVAASALSGYIDYPGDWTEVQPQKHIVRHDQKHREFANNTILAGFPATLSGELLFCHQDNLNTDGIYPGRYTYRDDLTPEQQARVAMQNYDQEFLKLVKKNDILVGGFNFGTGSSREQAATALKYCGISLILAGSFSETYKRNALNNAFLTIEAPNLVDDLKEQFGIAKATVRTGISVTIDFTTSLLKTSSRTYRITPVGTAAQRLIIAGGLQVWTREQLDNR
jgi:homoaconitate hydratase